MAAVFTALRSNCRQADFVLRRRIATAPTNPTPKTERVMGLGKVFLHFAD
jgi:hypothetical protein